MELYLQLGYGMMDHCKYLIEHWGGGTVILSPRDLKPNQLSNFAKEIKNLKGEVLLDPQVYLPRATHPRLQSHDYWHREYNTINFWSGAGLNEQLTKLLELNLELGCAAWILPGHSTSVVNDIWLECQRSTIEAAQKLQNNQFELIATVALNVDATKNPDQIHDLIESVKDWSVSTIYLICEPPKNQYLVDDPVWMTNLVDFIAGLRLSGKKVIVGYSSHQMLIAACASANAIASGTWLNVRSFTSEKFHAQEDKESRPTTWYYCPQALSEFTIPSLDLAAMRGMLTELKPLPNLGSSEADILFSGSQPSSTGFGQRESFRHYLKALRSQVFESRKNSFDESVNHHKHLLDSAENLLAMFPLDLGIRDKGRDFEAVIRTNRAALSYLEDYRGVILRRAWSKL
jgi:hypothetical protein